MLYKKNILPKTIFVSAILILLHKFYQSTISLPRNDYGFTEYLINYQGGFVRRGLLGEILLYLNQHFNLEPFRLILLFSYVCFCLLILFFIKKFREKGYRLFLLPFVFLLGNPIINNFWIRKDIFLVLLLIWILYIAVSNWKWKIVLLNIVLIFGILTHEAIAFFMFPVLFIVLYNKSSQSNSIKKIFYSGLQMLPSIIAFLVAVMHKGNAETSEKIWNSWKDVDFLVKLTPGTSKIPGAVNALSWSVDRGIAETMQYIFRNFNDGIYAPFFWLLMMILIYFILSHIHLTKIQMTDRQTQNSEKIRISNLLLVQLVGLSPLFILGCDYSRWIFFWTVSSLAAFLIVPAEYLNFPKSANRFTNFFNQKFSLFLNEKSLVVLSLLVGIPGVIWSIKNYVDSSLFFVILQYLSKIFKFVLKLLSF